LNRIIIGPRFSIECIGYVGAFPFEATLKVDDKTVRAVRQIATPGLRSPTIRVAQALKIRAAVQ
jgi:hypothetical protein